MLLSGFLWIGHQSAAFGIALGDKLPPLVIAALDGGKTPGFSTDQTLGKVTMMNFWATWCEACKVELLEMERDFKVLKSEMDLRLVYVNLDKDPRQAVDWAVKNLTDPQGFLKKTYMDPLFTVVEKLEVDSFPMTLVINRQGKISSIQRGYQPGKGLTEKLLSHLRHELQARPGAH